MVVHFRELGAHKSSVLELYRQLLRHTKFLPSNTIDSSNKDILLKDIKYLFKIQKKQMSPWIVIEKMNMGYSIEEKLRKVYNNEGNIQEVMSLVSNAKPVKNKENILRNVFGQPMKIDLNNLQDTNKQRVTNYVNRYIRDKQRNGELPKVIDPIIKETIIKDEALHQRALLDINRVTRIVNTGAYTVRITGTSKIRFIRGPWKQNKKISIMILNYKRKEQELFDLIDYYNTNKYLYNFETEWIKIHSNKKNDWSESILETIQTLQQNLDNKTNFFKEYATNKLPSILDRKQKYSNQIHEKYKFRYKIMMKQINGITPYDSMLGTPTLRDIVKKYKFES